MPSTTTDSSSIGASIAKDQELPVVNVDSHLEGRDAATLFENGDVGGVGVMDGEVGGVGVMDGEVGGVGVMSHLRGEWKEWADIVNDEQAQSQPQAPLQDQDKVQDQVRDQDKVEDHHVEEAHPRTKTPQTRPPSPDLHPPPPTVTTAVTALMPPMTMAPPRGPGV